MNPKNPRELLEQWLIGVKSRLLSHYECAKRFDSRAAKLGIPTVVFSAIVSVISQADATSYPHAQLLTTVVSVIVTICTGLQAFLHYPEQAEKHKAIAVKMSAMRRKIEIILATRDVTEADLAAFEKEWNEVDVSSPFIPETVYMRHQKRVASAGSEPVAS